MIDLIHQLLAKLLICVHYRCLSVRLKLVLDFIEIVVEWQDVVGTIEQYNSNCSEY